MIQPQIWQDPEFGSLTPLAKLIFIGMMTQADDDGRLRTDPRLIKTQLFPYDLSITPEQVMDALENIENICKNVFFYKTERDGVICQFVKWRIHQQLRDDRIQKSLLPPPPQSAAECGEPPRPAAQVKGSKGKGREVKRSVRAASCGDAPEHISKTLLNLRKELEEKGIIQKTKLL